MTSVSPFVVKRVAAAAELGAELAVVVDLAVEDDRDRAVLVVDRLVAGLEVDHPQPLDPERHVAVAVDPARVRAPVLERAHIRSGSPAATGVPRGRTCPTIPHIV